MPVTIEVILDAMVEGVIVVNASGRLLLANSTARSMLQWSLPVTGQHYLEVVRQPDVAAQFEAALASKTPQPVDVELDRQERRTFIAHAVPVAPEQGGGAVLVLRDVTDLRRIDQVRRDFVTNVSHELRTPLTAVRGYLEALRELPPPSPTLRNKFLDIIERHTGRMERLVKDLLRLARLDARQDTLEAADVTVASFVQALVHDLEVALTSKNQEVITCVAPGAETLRADPVRLSDALRNVLENASNYGPPGVPIEFNVARENGHIRFDVADRGPGIPDAALSRIFERFYRVDRSRSVDPGGTGLGLSIARHLVELHGGRITATNRPDGGAVVSVLIPAAPISERHSA